MTTSFGPKAQRSPHTDGRPTSGGNSLQQNGTDMPSGNSFSSRKERASLEAEQATRSALMDCYNG